VSENYDLILGDIARAKEYFAREDVTVPGYFYINTAALLALEAKVKLYMQDYQGAITAAKAALEARGGKLTANPADYDAMYTDNAASTEDIFTVVKSATDNPAAGSLSTMYPFYGLHIAEEVLAEYSATDIRRFLLNNGDGGKYIGTSEGSDAHNIPVLRLPEVYLNLAEAYGARGEYALARTTLLSLLEARDPDRNFDDVPENASIITAIRQARKLELLQEGHRYFDVRRWKEKINVVKGRYRDFDASLFAYPIPQTEINAGFGVVQTEGWDLALPK